ncbi:MAG: SH3 domain-containing protein [Myxococcales bacterium]|nr:SH3 domain-containing protein [Myxococcales bacterium]
MVLPGGGDGGAQAGDLAGAPAKMKDLAVVADLGDDTPDVTPDGGAPAMPDLSASDLASGIKIGGMARVTAGMLNLRDGPTTMDNILAVMACGTQVMVVGGPMNGWWNVKYQQFTGWASGNYLVAEAAFDPSVCGGKPDGGAPDMGGVLPNDQAGIINLCKGAVGYSYYWGHGSWRLDGQQIGSCMGNCPNCSHNGAYGADCSGLVSKCWQIPNPSPVTTDLHPYSTFNYFNQTTHWSVVPRAKIQPADALVHNANGAGHMVLFEKGNDPWGSVWVYECKGCSWGCVHNTRTFSADYKTIRREGL